MSQEDNKATEKKTGNLKPFNALTVEEQRNIAVMGGKKSVEVRKEKKIITSTLEMLLKTEIQDEDVKAQLEARGITEHTELKAMCLGMVKEARKNPTAFKEILDRLEGKVTDKVEHSGKIEMPTITITK